jgi:hypothetical protein
MNDGSKGFADAQPKGVAISSLGNVDTQVYVVFPIELESQTAATGGKKFLGAQHLLVPWKKSAHRWRRRTG